MGERLRNATALFYEGVRDRNAAAAMEKYAGAQYIQHVTGAADGAEGFVASVEEFHNLFRVNNIEVVRGFEDGSLVITQVLYTLNEGSAGVLTVNIFDTDDNAKLIEHWHVVEAVVTRRVGPHSQFDGPTEPTDLHKTEQNKDLVRRFLTTLGTPTFLDTLDQFVSTEGFVQHSPSVEDGIEGIRALVAAMAAEGASLAPVEVHQIIGCGSFVAAMYRVIVAASNSAVADIFRVEDDRLVEHWSVTESLPPGHEWVNNGTF